MILLWIGNSGNSAFQVDWKVKQKRRRVSFLIVSAAGWKSLEVAIVVELLGDDPD